jgi:diguanylate cyclase (GGDEF)-like protein
MNSGLILLDADAKVVLWNDWVASHSGISASLAVGQSLEMVFPEQLSNSFKLAIKNSLSYKLPIILSNALHRTPLPLYASPLSIGSRMRIEQSITLSPIIEGEHRFSLIQIADSSVSIRRERLLHVQSERLSKEVVTDGLTGLFNRRFFDESFKLEFVRAQRHQYPLTLLMIDVDFFKEYNDTYGHAAGDTVLIEIAKSLKTNSRESDIVARYGGEEFVAILPDCSSICGQIIGEKQRAAIALLNIKHESSIVTDYVTVSLGVATLIPSATCLPSTLFAMADQMLYEAKHSGRNQVRYSV